MSAKYNLAKYCLFVASNLIDDNKYDRAAKYTAVAHAILHGKGYYDVTDLCLFDDSAIISLLSDWSAELDGIRSVRK